MRLPPQLTHFVPVWALLGGRFDSLLGATCYSFASSFLLSARASSCRPPNTAWPVEAGVSSVGLGLPVCGVPSCARIRS